MHDFDLGSDVLDIPQFGYPALGWKFLKYRLYC